MSAHPFSTTSTSVALALANHLWQSTVVLGIIALLTLTLRQTSARIRYWLWLTASLKFLIPFSLLITLGGHLASLHPAQHHIQTNTAPFLAIDQLSQPFTIDTLPTLATPTAAPQISLTARAAALWNRTPAIPITLASLWLIGFLAVLTRWAHRWWKIASAIRLTHPLHAGPELATLRRMEHLAGLPPRIEMRSLPASMEPGIFGLLDPVLLWPHAITARLDDAHLEAVLAHEVCHVQRRDNLTAALHMLVEAIFWFHPLVWWLETRLVAEREHACDETVLQLCGQRTIYAESILKVCEFCIESPLACVSGVTGADLKKRIVQIMTERTIRKLTLGKKLLLTATALLVVAVPIVLGQTKSAQQMLLAAVNKTPAPFRAAVHAMMPIEDTPSTGLIAEMQTEPAPLATAENVPYVPKMKFDVASVRETKPDAKGRILMFIEQTPHTTHLRASFTIDSLLGIAYGIDRFQVVGAPNWPTAYTIEAKGDADADAKIAALPPDEQRIEQQHMLRALLEERFKLKTHWETKQGDAYNLVVVKGGPKLGAAGSMPPSVDVVKIFGDRPVPVLRQTASDGKPAWIAHDCSMGDWASILTTMFGRPVTDKTGLTGKYDFVIKYNRNTDSDRSAEDTDPTPPLDRALQEELGLKVEPTKAPVKVLVIEHIEKPTTVDGAEVPQTDLRPDPLKRRLRVSDFLLDPTAADPNKPRLQGSAVILAPMAAKAPVFEVASIRPNNSGSQGVAWGVSRTGYSASNAPLGRVILDAYLNVANSSTVRPPLDRVKGAPAWVINAPYDVTAKADDATIGAMKGLNQAQQIALEAPMLRTLLEERCKLVAHIAPVETQGYALVVGKHGIKMKETPPGEAMPANGLSFGGTWKTVARRTAEGKQSGVAYLGITMAELTAFAGSGATPVLDQTGLTGRYDVELPLIDTGSPEGGGGSAPTPRPDIAHLYDWQAIGLEMKPIKAPVLSVIIDHIERPSEN